MSAAAALIACLAATYGLLRTSQSLRLAGRLGVYYGGLSGIGVTAACSLAAFSTPDLPGLSALLTLVSIGLAQLLIAAALRATPLARRQLHRERLRAALVAACLGWSTAAILSAPASPQKPIAAGLLVSGLFIACSLALAALREESSLRTAAASLPTPRAIDSLADVRTLLLMLVITLAVVTVQGGI